MGGHRLAGLADPANRRPQFLGTAAADAILKQGQKA
jgi:hypothetical protein